MKNILFFSGDITRPGGTERVSTIIANALAKTGRFRVSFVSIVEQQPVPHFPIPAEIERFTLTNRTAMVPPGPGYLPLVPALRRFLRRRKPDVIIDIDIVLDVLSIPASAGLPVKVVAWEHFHYLFEQESLYRRLIARFSARFADYMVTLTPQDMCNYRDKLHRRDRIGFIYNPITMPISTGGSPARENIIITVGRLNHVKGIDMLAEIIPQVLCAHEDWSWYFLGAGEFQGMLEQVRQRHGLGDRLVLTGAVPNVEDYLKRAAICVLASRTEPFGMCILEALACGTPCVSFDVPYGPSIIIQDGENGFLIPPGDLAGMAEKITLLMDDAALRGRFSQNTSIGMERFRLEPILGQWERLLDSLTDSPGG